MIQFWEDVKSLSSITAVITSLWRWLSLTWGTIILCYDLVKWLKDLQNYIWWFASLNYFQNIQGFWPKILLAKQVCCTQEKTPKISCQPQQISFCEGIPCFSWNHSPVSQLSFAGWEQKVKHIQVNRFISINTEMNIKLISLFTFKRKGLVKPGSFKKDRST